MSRKAAAAALAVPVLAALYWGEDRAAQGRAAGYKAFLDHYPFIVFAGKGADDFTILDGTATYAKAVTPREQFGPQIVKGRPALIGRFDWVLCQAWDDIPEQRRSPDPHTVLTDGKRVQEVYELMARSPDVDAHHRDRVILVACGTSEDPLSKWGKKDLIQNLSKYFDTIYTVIKNVDVEGVKTFPIGLSEWWIRSAAHTAPPAIADASLDPASKTRGVLAAWGKYCNYTTWELPSRRQAREWAVTPAAIEAGVEARFVAPLSWWGTLSRYRFMLSPTGTAVQAAKMIEALLVLTVPIVQRGHGSSTAYDDLVRMGFPIVVVSAWQEVTAARLDEWWGALSPRLEDFRRRCITTDGYYNLVLTRGRSCGGA